MILGQGSYPSPGWEPLRQEESELASVVGLQHPRPVSGSTRPGTSGPNETRAPNRAPRWHILPRQLSRRPRRSLISSRHNHFSPLIIVELVQGREPGKERARQDAPCPGRAEGPHAPPSTGRTPLGGKRKREPPRLVKAAPSASARRQRSKYIEPHHYSHCLQSVSSDQHGDLVSRYFHVFVHGCVPGMSHAARHVLNTRPYVLKAHSCLGSLGHRKEHSRLTPSPSYQARGRMCWADEVRAPGSIPGCPDSFWVFSLKFFLLALVF